MDPAPYPVDLRTEYPERSSRGWAVLTILFMIKLWLALFPHWFVLIFLGIAQWVVAFVAQFVVAFKGEYPAGMHRFVVGVLRWNTRVSAFGLSLNDRYPPFTLEPVADYPVDVTVERPERPSRAYAAFTIIVQILALVLGIWLVVWLVQNTDAVSWSAEDRGSNWSSFSLSGGSGLLLRQLAAIPHYIVLFFVAIAVGIIWFIIQWVILFVARYPQELWGLTAGWLRWAVRVNAYALGLVDRYPPFSFDPSQATPAPPPPPAAQWPAAPPAPPAPTPPPPVPGENAPPPAGETPAPSDEASPTATPPPDSSAVPPASSADPSAVPPAPSAPPPPSSPQPEGPAPEEPRQP